MLIDCDFFMFRDKLDHITGPRYLETCLPYIVLLILAIAKSPAFLSLYPDLFELERSAMYLGHKLFLTLYIRIVISCSPLLSRVGSLSLTGSLLYVILLPGYIALNA